jgi:hypothetical protein
MPAALACRGPTTACLPAHIAHGPLSRPPPPHTHARAHAHTCTHARAQPHAGPHHFQGSTGYGHGDLGREALDEVRAAACVCVA